MKVYERKDLATRAVFFAVATQVWPLLVVVTLLLVAGVAWSISSGEKVPAEMSWWFFKLAAIGLVGSFALHESAHVMVLRRIETVTHLAVDRTTWRLSIFPFGALSARQVVGVAVAGPLCCVLVGSVLWLSALDRTLAWWYLVHGVFLLPLFGDGRSLLSGLRGRGTRLAVVDQPGGSGL